MRVAVLALTFAVASSLGAQQIGPRIVQPHADCDLTRHAIDQPWPRVNVMQARWAYHVEKWAIGYLASLITRRAWFAPSVSLALHAIGVSRRTYPLDPLDVVEDAWSFGAHPSWRWLVVDLGLACYASP